MQQTLKIKGFKCTEMWDGPGRVGGCWSFVTGISSRANNRKSKGCVSVHSSLVNKTKQKSAILMKDIDNGEGYAWVGTEVYGKSPYLSLNLL